MRNHHDMRSTLDDDRFLRVGALRHEGLAQIGGVALELHLLVGQVDQPLAGCRGQHAVLPLAADGLPIGDLIVLRPGTATLTEPQRVRGLVAGSAAAKAGVMEGDVILSFEASLLRPDKEAVLTVQRAGKTLALRFRPAKPGAKREGFEWVLRRPGSG